MAMSNNLQKYHFKQHFSKREYEFKITDMCAYNVLSISHFMLSRFSTNICLFEILG